MQHLLLRSGNSIGGFSMEFDQIKELIQIIDSSSLAFFEFSNGDSHIKMDKSLNRISNNDNEKKEIISDRNKVINDLNINRQRNQQEKKKLKKMIT